MKRQLACEAQNEKTFRREERFILTEYRPQLLAVT